MPPAAPHDPVVLSSSSPPPFIPDSDIIATPPHLRDSPQLQWHPWHAPPQPQPQSPLLSRDGGGGGGGSGCDSSPNSLPSPSLLFKRPLPGLKSGSRAARVPEGVALGFASAGALVRERVLSLKEDDEAQKAEEGGADGRRKTAKHAPRKKVEGGAAKKGRKDEKKDGPEAGSGAVLEVGFEAEPVDGESVEGEVSVERAAKRKKKDDGEAVEGAPVEKPKRRKAKATVNNSDMIREALGLGPAEEAQPSKSAEGGAVAKLQKRKAKTNAAPAPAIPAEDGRSGRTARQDTALNEAVQEQPAKVQKTVVKKPRAPRTKKSNDNSAGPAKDEEAAKASKPPKRQPKARKATETASKHFSPDNLVDVAARKAEVSTAHLADVSTGHRADEPVAVVNEPAQPLDISPAMMRRQSWTPPKDTKSSPIMTRGHDPLKPIELDESPNEKSPAARVPKPSFAALLMDFNYNEQTIDSGASTPRTESGEAFTKRRRLQLIDNPNRSAEVSETESREAPSEKADKPAKAPKKKPRTITDLVTAAYRPTAPAEDPEPHLPPVDPKVSVFFAPHTGSTSVGDQTEGPIAEKPKRAGRSKSSTKKAEPKAKKPTAKSKKAAKFAVEKLLSPESALLKMNRQDVLFGTSSQLAREDSPTFIRDLQQAIRDSEMMGTQKDGLETLHSKPAAAGTGLSLIGRRKGLWAAACRDFEDGVLEQEGNPISQDNEPDILMEESIVLLPDVLKKGPSPAQDQTMATHVETSKQATQQASVLEITDSADETYDLPEAPAPNPLVEDDGFESIPSAQPIQLSSDFIDIDEFDDHHFSRSQSYSTLPTSYSTSRPSPNVRRTALQPLATRPNIPLRPNFASDVFSTREMATKARAKAKETAIEPATSPAKRPVGRPRKVITPEPETSPTKRPRGRPRKNAAAAEEEASEARMDKDTPVIEVDSPPKRARGRPRKSSVEAPSEVRASSPKKAAAEVASKGRASSPKKGTAGATSKVRASSPKRSTTETASKGRASSQKKSSTEAASKGRTSSPKRATAEAASEDRAPTRKKRARSPSTAAPAATTPKKGRKKKEELADDKDEEWPDIDEIEDSDEPISPSPPRRSKKAAGAPSSPPLTLSLSQEGPASPKAPRTATTTTTTSRSTASRTSRKLKPVDTAPPGSLDAVFALITAAVKACPPSAHPARPSWHEKMLLYDPIVAEDLAAWLNAQGVRMSVFAAAARARKKKPTEKKKRKEGGKEQGAAADREEDVDGDGAPVVDEVVAEPQRPTKMEEVPAWAVQLWCEENSVCCIYKENLWSTRNKGKKKKKKARRR